MKKAILIAVMLFSIQWSGSAQTLNDDFSYIETNYLKEGKPAIIILYSSEDCSKCVMPLHNLANIIKELSQNEDFRSIIVSDNFALANKFNKQSGLNTSVKFDKTVFEKSTIGGYKSSIILYSGQRFEQISLQEIEEMKIIDFFRSDNKQRNSALYSFVDSFFSFGYFVGCGVPDGILLFDEQVQMGVISDLSSHLYATPIFTDSMKIADLAYRIDRTRFSPLTYNEGLSRMQQNGIERLRVHSIAAIDSTLFISFSLNRCFKEKNKMDDYGIFTSNYIARKQVRKEADLLSAFDLNTYEQFWFVDSFRYENRIYPIGVWIKQQLEIVDSHTFKINVNYQNDEEKKYEFGGRATIDVASNKIANMIKLDENALAQIVIDNHLVYKGRKLSFEKEIIDESKSIGTIKIIEVR